ncbi:MAG: molybdopterin-dependent oxidoreductase, partial [Armatimonadota bacterium]|nr:molybdopterin-dependent oxidoreductase [Armatimonadota bacterium]
MDDRAQRESAGLGRRAFLQGATVAVLSVVDPAQRGLLTKALAQPSGGTTRPSNTSFSGLIIRERDPDSLEFPFSTLDSFITPNDRFFIRNHFGVPGIDARGFRLQVEGAVERPFEITYDELLKMPSRSIVATLEDPGNGRV